MSELHRFAKSSGDVSRPLPVQNYEMRDKLAAMEAEMARQAAADSDSDNSNTSWAMPKPKAKAARGTWMRTAEDWTNQLERANPAIFEKASASPSDYQGTLSGGADETLLYFPELTQEPLPSNDGCTLSEAADKPFLELAQKVERLERVVRDLQDWRAACAGQAPPPPPDAAIMQRPVLASHGTRPALATVIDNESQPRLHNSNAIIQPAGHNTAAGVSCVANERWTVVRDNKGEPSKVVQDTTKNVHLTEPDVHTKNSTAAVAASALIAVSNDFQDAPQAKSDSSRTEQEKWDRQHGVYKLQPSLWDSALLIGYHPVSSEHICFVTW